MKLPELLAGSIKVLHRRLQRLGDLVRVLLRKEVAQGQTYGSGNPHESFQGDVGLAGLDLDYIALAATYDPREVLLAELRKFA